MKAEVRKAQERAVKQIESHGVFEVVTLVDNGGAFIRPRNIVAIPRQLSHKELVKLGEIEATCPTMPERNDYRLGMEG